MATNQILPFGTAAGANVLSPAEYLALASRTAGFQSGVAKSRELNTVWRQSSFVTSMLAQYIADKSGKDVLDNGDLPALQAKFVEALEKQSGLSRLAAYTSAGTVSFTVPPGCFRICAEAWGAGAGGGSGGGVSSGNAGGAGSYGLKWIDVVPGQVISVVVGAGGAGGINVLAGGNGGASSVGAFMSCPGGFAGFGGGTGGGSGGAEPSGADFGLSGSPGVGPSISAGALVYGWPGGSAPRSRAQAPGPSISLGQNGLAPGGGGGGGAGGSGGYFNGGPGGDGWVIIWG